jgi:hypothetical protein
MQRDYAGKPFPCHFLFCKNGCMLSVSISSLLSIFHKAVIGVRRSVHVFLNLTVLDNYRVLWLFFFFFFFLHHFVSVIANVKPPIKGTDRVIAYQG